ncbi:Hsp70 family protein [Micromonospora sp. NPDC050397]|uniref:Hsp70 family protein n=1 Tax=Micromonospora sp. NPDC050397 TaxID=3364279 RepID=UPI00384C272F
MAYVLGIDIGGTRATAAVARLWDNTWSPAEVAWLTPHSPTVPPVLHLAANGALTVGDPIEAGGQVDPGHIARDFVARVGDPVPLLVGGESYAAPALTAALAGWMVEQVVTREGGPPDRIVLSHPAGWGGHRRGLLHAALWELGLGDVTLLSEAITSAESHVATGFTGRTLAVHSLTERGCTTSVVGRARAGGFTVLASAGEGDAYGGPELDLDAALGDHVRAELGRQLGPRQLDDPRVRVALLGLPKECARARERLAVATDTDVRLHLPHGPIRVPVTRDRFTELVRPAVQLTVQTLVETVRASGLPAGQLDGVLLVGDWARTPLVAELVETHFPGLVTVGADPETSAAAGAAVAAGQILLPTHPAPRPPEHRPTDPHPGATGPGRPGPAPAHPDPEWTRSGPTTPRPPAGDLVRADARTEPPPRPPIRITPLNLPKPRGTGLRTTGRTESSGTGRDLADQRPGRSSSRGHR